MFSKYGILVKTDGEILPSLMLGKGKKDICRQADLFGGTGGYGGLFEGDYFGPLHGDEIRELIFQTKKIKTPEDAEALCKNLTLIEEKYKNSTQPTQ